MQHKGGVQSADLDDGSTFEDSMPAPPPPTELDFSVRVEELRPRPDVRDLKKRSPEKKEEQDKDETEGKIKMQGQFSVPNTYQQQASNAELWISTMERSDELSESLKKSLKEVRAKLEEVEERARLAVGVIRAQVATIKLKWQQDQDTLQRDKNQAVHDERQKDNPLATLYQRDESKKGDDKKEKDKKQKDKKEEDYQAWVDLLNAFIKRREQYGKDADWRDIHSDVLEGFKEERRQKAKAE